MITDHDALIDHQEHERELAERLERRRIAAERAAMGFDGNRLALIAHLARAARAVQANPVESVSC